MGVNILAKTSHYYGNYYTAASSSVVIGASVGVTVAVIVFAMVTVV